MALQRQPGFTGLKYGRVSSMDARAIGKLTDSNHLESLTHGGAPADYDKKIISLYSQSSLYSNDFLNMLQKSTPFYITGNTDSWKWGIEVPYQFTKIVDVPASTYAQDFVGIDGKEFSFVLDYKVSKNEMIKLGHKVFGPSIYITTDPVPHGRGWLTNATLLSGNPTTDYVDKKWLQAGVEIIRDFGGIIGEFDQDLVGLDKMGSKIELFDTVGSANGREHTITGWADARTLRDSKGQPLDLLMFVENRRNELPVTKQSVRWEPLIESQLRIKMLQDKVNRMFWSDPGVARTNGGKGELKKVSAGIIPRMRKSGNYIGYNRGEFSANLLRTAFGDLFYRRVAVRDRHVKLYTNEAGLDVFQQAVKEDALNSGITFVANVDAVASGKVNSDSAQNNLTYSWAFNSMYSRESGLIEVSHLQELDLPQTSSEFGQNKKSTPIFLVFDLSESTGGSQNIREVRLEGKPNMTWGYIDGRTHHLGFAASQGHSAGQKLDGYTLFFDDRYDVFIEDMSRMFLIEELPQY